MTTPRRRAVSVFSLVVLVGVLSGCTSIGIRPSEPPFVMVATAGACMEYKKYSEYAQELQEAYHTRATQNRGWLYIAGILGLGVAAASGGLAIATTAAAGTLGLLSISGGFAAGSFATINNEALALSYTAAANRVDEALTDSRQKLVFADPTKNEPTAGSCAAALPILIVGVSNARTHLEVARTDNAAGALARARDQLTLLNKQINDQLAVVQAADVTRIILAAEITKAEPNELRPAVAKGTVPETTVKLTVRAKLGGFGTEDLKVTLDSTDYKVSSIKQPNTNDSTTFEVEFKAPASDKLPDQAKKEYMPELVVHGKGGPTRVKSASGVKLSYKDEPEP